MASSTTGSGRAAPWLDVLAIGASGACLLHCLFLPLTFAILPAAARFIELPESFHIAAFATAVPASALAIIAGYRRHGALLPGIIAGPGLLLIGFGALGGFDLILETGLSVLGSVILAVGHLTNGRLRSRGLVHPPVQADGV
jgi:hypothetical protein